MGHACRIAAVVPTYNRRAALEQCLAALMRQTRPLDEVFVIDNASLDGTEEMVRDRFPQGVALIRLEDNGGSAGGYYEGIRAAYLKGYDWIWAMDNDAEAEPDALEQLVKSPCFADSRVGLLGSLIVGREGRIQYGHGVRFSPLMRETPAESECSGKPVRLDAKSYTGALFHRRAIDAVGLPRRDYFVYQDDLDYTYRLSRKLDILLVPQSRVIHESDCRLVEKSLWFVRSRRWRFEDRWQVYYSVRNRIYFVSRSARRYAVPVLVLKTALTLMRNIFAIAAFDDEKYQRVRLIVRAVLQGLAGRLGKSAAF